MTLGPADGPDVDDDPDFGSSDAMKALGSIYEVTTDPSLSFEEKIDRLLSIGVSELGVSYGFLSRIAVEDLESEQGTQTIVDAKGDHELLQAGQSAPLSQAYCRKTIKSDGLLAVHDAIETGWEGDPAYETFQLGSYIGGKVEVEDELYGTFCFASAGPRAEEFSAVERVFVRVLSKWASYELQQNRTRERLERKNEQLGNFANVVSHDLRNPLMVAKGRLELAREKQDNEHLAAVETAHDRMGDLIEDLLSLAREGTSAAEPEPVSLRAIADESWETVPSEGVALEVETEREIWADASRLRQLFENLMRNALEHGAENCDPTAQGPVGVTRIRIGEVEGGFFVEDDGCGIPAEDESKVLEAGYTTNIDGTGLGLSIVSEIVSAHEWAFSVGAGTEGGARFEFTDVDVVTE